MKVFLLLGMLLINSLSFASVCNEGLSTNPISFSDTVACKINPVTDLDTFGFFGTKGDVIRITGLSDNTNFRMRLEVRDPKGKLLHDSWSYSSIVHEFTMEETGNYLINISDSRVNNKAEYEVRVECKSGTCLNITNNTSVESEFTPTICIDNNLIMPIYYWQTTTCKIEKSIDLDTFDLLGKKGDVVRVTGLSDNTDFRMRLEVRDPKGKLLHDSWSYSSIVYEFTMEETGNYLISISDSRVNNEAEYEIRVECKFGTCMTPSKSNVNFNFSNTTLNIPFLNLIGTDDNKLYNIEMSLVPNKEPITFELKGMKVVD